VASVRLVGNLVCLLGEGLYWDARTQFLCGVDIQGKRLWRWDLVSHPPPGLATGTAGGLGATHYASREIVTGLARGFCAR
jgi:sugar lactone lactonase YvrE